MPVTTATNWVVYSICVDGNPDAARGVCREDEWEAVQLARPGLYSLVLAGVRSEPEAERLARRAAGESRPRPTKALRFAKVFIDAPRESIGAMVD
jgi:hypothetical protein